jgi:glycosyltransferase involved in cell wall biosynthesis
MLLSIVIPAFNEELYLPETLSSIQRASAECRCGVELIVVDNASSDRTAKVAKEYGATVVHEAIHNVGRVRNAGAEAAHGDVLVLIDADTVVSPQFLDKVADVMSDPACIGGSPNIVQRVRSRLLQAYLGAWRWIGVRLGMAQGAAQFCRKSAFSILNGYDESQFMGEDVDFYWRLRKLCAKAGGYLKFLNDVTVAPSPRRFDHNSVWRTLIWTNPVFIAPFRKSRSAWSAWYTRPPR